MPRRLPELEIEKANGIRRVERLARQRLGLGELALLKVARRQGVEAIERQQVGHRRAHRGVGTDGTIVGIGRR